nr:alpha/beta hydrolase [Streptomyces sp. S1D4-11]
MSPVSSAPPSSRRSIPPGPRRVCWPPRRRSRPYPDRPSPPRKRRSKHIVITTPEAKNVVLVHGGFVDGSGWRGVYDLLRADGYTVSVVQNPTLSLEGDVATTRRVLDAQDGPTVLVGHSYGGAVISEAGNHEKVSALVYVAAFAPDKGESVNTLIADPPPGAPVPPILPPNDGFLFLDREKFAASFAGDLPADEARFLADSQVPWGLEALGGTVTLPAWRTKPSFYLVAADDRMIPPPAQRAMAERAGATVSETGGSHAVYVSKPGEVAALVKKAAAGASA